MRKASYCFNENYNINFILPKTKYNKIYMRPKYEYEIKVENKVVWKGLNPKEVYSDIRKKYPNKKIGVAWRSKNGDVIF